jgi:hypothetical protein
MSRSRGVSEESHRAKIDVMRPTAFRTFLQGWLLGEVPRGQNSHLVANDYEDWWRRVDSNHRHRAYETPALPTELRRQRTDKLEALLAEITAESRSHDRKAPGRCQGHIQVCADSQKKFLVVLTKL